MKIPDATTMPGQESKVNEIHVLTGCTAVGKTDLSLEWAARANAEIISADSLLFYRGMDIGTAKPSAEQRARIPHHLIDVSPVSEQWDVKRYVETARTVAAEIASRGRRILVTGGSGFYLKSFWAPVAAPLEIPPEVRETVGRLEREGLPVMLEKLGELNPEGLGDLDARNPRRVAKALERCLASGRSVVELRKEHLASASPFAGATVRVTILEREPDELRSRIDRRVDEMLAAGLVEEVRELMERRIGENPSAAGAIGYRETLRFLKGELGRDDLPDEIKRNTHRLARKQRTWFRTQTPPGTRRLNLTARPEVSVRDLFGESGR